MPSPACQVKDGGGAYSATTNGVNVTPSNTVTINLISSAGVNSWSITCIATDELSSAATVTSSLVIDTVAKTATFTAPVAGRAYLFQSKINGGIGPDGTAQASYTTTFGVYTLTGGRRVHAVGETFESNATFGWEADINDLIRNPGSGASPGGVDGDIQIKSGSSLAGLTPPAGSLVGTTATQTLTNKTIDADSNTITNIENADIKTTAAIAGTKIAPDFGAQNVVTTGYGAFGGSTLPSTGTVRLPSGSTIKYVAGGTDRPFVELTSLAEIIFGDFTSAVAILNRVGSGGVIYNQVNSTNLWTIGESGIQAFSSSFAFGGGVGVIGITNRTTAPTTNPSGGGILYAESGAGKWRGSGGTVTTFGPAEPHCPRCGTDVGVSESENDLFGEELVHCHACELRTGNGVVRHVADFFERRKVA